MRITDAQRRGLEMLLAGVNPRRLEVGQVHNEKSIGNMKQGITGTSKTDKGHTDAQSRCKKDL